MASSWAVSRGNAQAAKRKELLELGLYLNIKPSKEEQCFLSSISQTPSDAAQRLIFADWLEERGRAEEALVLRLIAANMGHRGDYVRSGWVRKADGKPTEDDEKVSDNTHRFERRQLFAPSQWSVVRRITEGANGGHRQHTVRWERTTITVIRCTKSTAFLENGKQIRLSTLTACVRLDA